MLCAECECEPEDAHASNASGLPHTECKCGSEKAFCAAETCLSMCCSHLYGDRCFGDDKFVRCKCCLKLYCANHKDQVKGCPHYPKTFCYNLLCAFCQASVCDRCHDEHEDVCYDPSHLNLPQTHAQMEAIQRITEEQDVTGSMHDSEADSCYHHDLDYDDIVDQFYARF